MIPRAEFDAYNRAVANISEGAAARVEREVWAWLQLNPEASVAECRDYAALVMSGVAQSYGEAAAALAAEWYDEQAAGHGYKLPAAVTSTAYSAEQVERAARYQAQKLVSGDARGFARGCGELARNDALRSLNATVMANAKRDRGRGVRFARVTTGAETCAFCYMLSSRGAVYHTRKTAGEFVHFHRNCDCKVVPGFGDGEAVEGYDPAGMRERMRRIKEETGLSFAKPSDSRAISEYMAMHDPRWLMDGSPGVVSKEAGAKPWKKEQEVAHILADNGFDVRFIKEPKTQKIPDAYLGKETWEFKIPEAFGPKTVKNQFKKAIGKGTSRLLISNTKNNADAAEMIDEIRSILASDDFPEIDEVLFVGSDGQISLLKR